ncbi:hypothetical protein M404DRAFT_999924 [Pisolithus tinctorius Marx 270]|uniref:Uncharacterized protein n=1 Tax=Pisolithus tinctorius Marx 270 TaxID=870435 RepID=A0A0C3PBK4_PISTI|nr:hypothetical protein M404DRAFT_999924 [Pisolithus tinctorius Marx 270]
MTTFPIPALKKNISSGHDIENAANRLPLPLGKVYEAFLTRGLTRETCRVIHCTSSCEARPGGFVLPDPASKVCDEDRYIIVGPGTEPYHSTP